MEQWMKEALKLAQAAGLEGEVPVGAVLVRDGQVIARGANSRERSGRTAGHAEIQALEDYSNRTGQWRVPQGTSLIVTVEPCLMCTGALLWARVESVFFGCRDPKSAGLTEILPLIEHGKFDHRFKEVVGGVQQDACKELIQGFFRNRRVEKSTGVDSRLTQSPKPVSIYD